MSSLAKYRPVLTGAQIAHILESLRGLTMSPVNRTTIQSLELFEYKIKKEITKPSYIESPKQGLGEKLGLCDIAVSLEQTPAQKRLLAYQMWEVATKQGNVNILSVDTISQAQTYRYENDLMSQPELVSYESEMFKMD